MLCSPPGIVSTASITPPSAAPKHAIEASSQRPIRTPPPPTGRAPASSRIGRNEPCGNRGITPTLPRGRSSLCGPATSRTPSGRPQPQGGGGEIRTPDGVATTGDACRDGAHFDIEYESDAKVRKFLKSERVPPVTPESKTWGNRTIDIVRRSLIQHGYEPDPLFLEDRNAYYWRQCRVACISALGGPDRIKFDGPLELSLLPEKKQRRFIKAVKDNPPRENLGDELAPWFLEAVYWTVYRDATGFEADLDEQIENHRPKRSRVQSGRRGPRADQSIGYDYGGRW